MSSGHRLWDSVSAISPVINKPVPRTLFNLQPFVFWKTQSSWIQGTPENSSSNGKRKAELFQSKVSSWVEAMIENNIPLTFTIMANHWEINTVKNLHQGYKTLWGGCQGLGGGGGGLLFNGYRVFSFARCKEFWRWICNKVNTLNTTSLYTQKWLRWQILCYVFFHTSF